MNHNHDVCLGKNWSGQSLSEELRIKWGFNPRSFSCIGIAGSHGPVRNAVDTALQSQSLQSLSTSETKKVFDKLPRPGKLKFRPVCWIAFFWCRTLEKNHERIMIVGDNGMVTNLQSSPSWLADGTFVLRPKMFYQLYTVHIQGPAIALACVYGFLSNKTESICKRFLDVLLSLLPNAAPDEVLIDFQLAAMKTFKRHCPMLLYRDASSIYHRILSLK